MTPLQWLDVVANVLLMIAAGAVVGAGVWVARSASAVRETARETRRLRREFEKGRRRRLEALTGERALWCSRCGDVLEPSRVAHDADFCEECEGTTIQFGEA